MPSVTVNPSPASLFYHLPEHRVLICKQCRYAIQPSAISRHLKELHHIYRSDRQRLVEYALDLQLADPEDVVLPAPSSAPVAFLPIEDGLACKVEGCMHLCVTTKRMKSHRATSHSTAACSSDQWRQVRLQTFFRGNRLKYFIVAGHTAPESKSEQILLVDHKSSSIVTTQTSEIKSECATIIANLPFPCSSDFRADNDFLCNHFTQYTYYDMGRTDECRRVWKTYIPKISHCHEFLMHGMLACSAFHLAYLQPHNRQRYRMVGTCHQARALPQFRETIAAPSKDNCDAIVAFSQLLIVNCFASEEQDEDFLLVKESCNSELPYWLQIIRGSCTLLESVWEHLRVGELAPLVQENAMANGIALPLVPENPIYAARLKELLTIPFFSASLFKKSVAWDDHMTTYTGALMHLCRAFSIAADSKERGTFTMWMAVYIWPVKVSLEYLELLKAREPVALLLVAHYCVLLSLLDDLWYTSGLCKRILDRIYMQLDEEWRRWLAWPFQEVGLEYPGARDGSTNQDPMDGVQYERPEN